MREIVSLHVGGAGNKIGASFVETLCAEHGIGPTGARIISPEAHASAAAGARTHASGAGAGEPVEGAGGSNSASAGAAAGAIAAMATARQSRRALDVYFSEGKRG